MMKIDFDKTKKFQNELEDLMKRHGGELIENDEYDTNDELSGSSFHFVGPEIFLNVFDISW